MKNKRKKDNVEVAGRPVYSSKIKMSVKKNRKKEHDTENTDSQTAKKIKETNKLPLRWSMMGMLVMGWLLPLVLIAFCLLYFVSDMIGKQIEKTIYYSTEKSVEICEMEISAIMSASKNASYNTTIKDSYEQYQTDHRRYLLGKQIEDFLREQYKYDSNFLCTMVYLLNEPEYIYYTYNTYRDNNKNLSAYNRVIYFQENVQSTALEISEELDTKTTFLMNDNRLYMVRNLVESDFKPFAMIVIELSPQYVFESLKNVWGALDYEIFVDGAPLFGKEWGNVLNLDEIRKLSGSGGYINDKRGAYSFRSFKMGSEEMICVIQLDPGTLIDDVKMLGWALALVLVFMIPLVIMVFHFFHTRVNKPVAGLVAASREIGEGNYGHLVEETGDSQEFDYLEKAFNSMSVELKYQFEQIYLEELALRDANIMALQSQINPHFLNNTLEIINWEARMNGNDKVSGMIEALATMLNATMNRKQKRFIPLSQELEYVDAYLYIIKQRFGERFQVSKEIDERLLDQEVPLLIIQPIVENAVEHGMDSKRGGQVKLHIYADAIEAEEKPEQESEDVSENKQKTFEKMYIEVVNNGALSEEDQSRITYLLGDSGQDENEHHISLGIRNVDRRLKIIYGEECGLSIKSDNKNQTVSTIIVKLNKDNNNSQ